MKVAWGGTTGNRQGEANNVSQADGDSDMAPVSSLGRGLIKEIMASASTFI